MGFRIGFMKLSDLKDGAIALVVKVRGSGEFRKRIVEMGFVKGKEVQVIKNAPLKDPVEYMIMGYVVSLRRKEASLIEVEEVQSGKHEEHGFSLLLTQKEFSNKERYHRDPDFIKVALVGNPNSGKTSLFNNASGSNEHVGNYSGVTVDIKKGTIKSGKYTIEITDLPGTYSLNAYSPEEIYVRDFIHHQKPDIIINVIDASNLERNLFLTTQLIDMEVKMVVALNMYDELNKNGDTFDFNSLGKMIGIPFIPTISSRSKGIDELFDAVLQVFEDKIDNKRQIHINYGDLIESAIASLQKHFDAAEFGNLPYSKRFTAIKLLEKDQQLSQYFQTNYPQHELFSILQREIKKIEALTGEPSETFMADVRYGFISGALKENFSAGKKKKWEATQIIDTFLTHKILSYPVFLFFVYLMFQATFYLGEFPKQWLEAFVNIMSETVALIIPASLFKELIIDGIISGVGGVLVFLPNIMILFLCISIMEDTGYMARVAFIMDKVMHRIGLHGKSFIPLLMGFGCNVPAIMAARTVENRYNRIITILINPFMSCSARLPVYLLFISIFFEKNRAEVLFFIYGLGILLAVISALMLRKFVFRQKEIPFVMELPPYRMPTLKSVIRHMWYRAGNYLKKMGGIILLASIIIWALGVLPRNVDYSENYSKKIYLIERSFEERIENLGTYNSDTLNNIYSERDIAVNAVKIEKNTERQEKSYIGKLGKFIEPAIAPLGFDWKMGLSLISGLAAKEVVISTLAVLYQSDVSFKDNKQSLPKTISMVEYKDGPKVGKKVFTPLVAISFMTFILIYFPCVAVIAAIGRETGSWKYALFTIIYTTVLAWLMAFAIFQTGSAMGY